MRAATNRSQATARFMVRATSADEGAARVVPFAGEALPAPATRLFSVRVAGPEGNSFSDRKLNSVRQANEHR